jgi:hypothetical protein
MGMGTTIRGGSGDEGRGMGVWPILSRIFMRNPLVFFFKFTVKS